MANWSIQFIFILSCLCTFHCQTPGAKPHLPSDQTATTESNEVKKVHVRQAWIQMDKDLKSGVGKIIRRAMPYLMKEIYKKDVTASCLGALMQLSTALRQSKLWAYKMLDSSGRFPEGFLSGTLTSLGNYEECVNIHVNETKLKLQGQYCTISLNPPIPSWKPFTTVHFPMPELVNVSGPDTAAVENLETQTVQQQ
ncbi:uncharacterized protein LOC129230376 [Uloborus diversus]|uniref:uncharacterized protein LOC129230376 n=1 Tax=Uloborus diversus TaxID=327109 RepID=UPI0024093736|nr:uncharacterized protein LOC129230376 [Uloborus diversus]